VNIGLLKTGIMSSGCQIKEQNELHYLTFQVVEWVDIFSRKIYRDIVIDSLRYCQKNKGLEIYAFVVMSNHIHLLAKSPNRDLSDVVREFKSFTAREILKAIEEEPESRRE
jgi:REP element-mobilizing transposase RayT